MNMIQDFNTLSDHTSTEFSVSNSNLLLQGNNTVSSKNNNKHPSITALQKFVWFCAKLLSLQSVK